MKNCLFTGLIIGKGRWTHELQEGDFILDENGNKFKITYQKEWGAFIADQDGGDVLFLAQNSKWTDGEKLDISKCKLVKSNEAEGEED